MNRIIISAYLLLSTACATTGATLNSGVGDRFIEHPPWYAGAGHDGSTMTIAHLPVLYQRGASQPALMDPQAGAGSPVAALIDEMTGWLDSLNQTRRISADVAPKGTAPDVQFGCEQNITDDCEVRDEAVLGRRGTTMRLAVGRPSAEWIANLGRALDASGASHALVITLEVGQYWTRQTGLRGTKSVELGTNHTMSLPWLTSLEAPVSVLQLTGAIIDREGKAVRIGAEGILARRTSLAGSAVGLQRILRDEDIEQARALRRDDLPGQPLAWQAALRELVTRLVGAGGPADGVPE